MKNLQAIDERFTDAIGDCEQRLREIEGWSYGKLAKAFEVSKDYVVRLCQYRTR